MTKSSTQSLETPSPTLSPRIKRPLATETKTPQLSLPPPPSPNTPQVELQKGHGACLRGRAREAGAQWILRVLLKRQPNPKNLCGGSLQGERCKDSPSGRTRRRHRVRKQQTKGKLKVDVCRGHGLPHVPGVGQHIAVGRTRRGLCQGKWAREVETGK